MQKDCICSLISRKLCRAILYSKWRLEYCLRKHLILIELHAGSALQLSQSLCLLSLHPLKINLIPHHYRWRRAWSVSFILSVLCPFCQYFNLKLEDFSSQRQNVINLPLSSNAVKVDFYFLFFLFFIFSLKKIQVV